MIKSENKGEVVEKGWKALSSIRQLLTNVKVNRQVIGNTEYLVFPTVASKSGVMNNIYYSDELMEVNASQWENVPVIINHTVNKQGEDVGVHDPSAVNRVVVGHTANPQFKDGKLIVDFYINLEQLENSEYSFLRSHLEDGQSMEVSIGVIACMDFGEGEYEGDYYFASVAMFRADHIAILPHELGACSLKDGCGTMRSNCQKDKPCEACQKRQLIEVINRHKLCVNNISFGEIYTQIDSLLQDQRRDYEEYAYVIEIYPNEVIFQQGIQFYRQPYTVSESQGLVSFVGGKVEVRRIVTYENITGIPDDGMPRRKLEVDVMSKEKEAEPENHTPDETPVVKTEHEGVFISNEEYAFLKDLKSRETQRLSELKVEINKSNENLTIAMLDNMEASAIEALHKSIPKKVDFTANGSQPINNDTPKTFKYPPIVGAKRKVGGES